MLRVQTNRWLDVYLGFIALMTLLYGGYTARASRAWAISDWLINYQGGFVRRGLAGEVIFRAARGLHVSPVLLTLLVCYALYAVLLLSVRELARQSSYDLWVALLLVSPATLAFPILDPTAGFRKDVIYLAALALLLVLLRRRGLANWGITIYLSLALGVETLSHEPLICYAPYFLAGLLVAGYRLRRALTLCALPLLVGLLAAYVATTHAGDQGTAVRICASLGYPLMPPGREICSGGAIAYFGHTQGMARSETLAVIRSKQYLQMYPALGLLALLPCFAGAWTLARGGHGRQVLAIAGPAGAAWCGSFVLYLYAEDWGRWTYMHVLSLAMLLLFADGNKEPSPQVWVEVSPKRRLWAMVLVLLYGICWSLPCASKAADYLEDAGYAGLVHHLVDRRQRLQVVNQRISRLTRSRRPFSVSPWAKK